MLCIVDTISPVGHKKFNRDFATVFFQAGFTEIMFVSHEQMRAAVGNLGTLHISIPEKLYIHKNNSTFPQWLNVKLSITQKLLWRIDEFRRLRFAASTIGANSAVKCVVYFSCDPLSLLLSPNLPHRKFIVMHDAGALVTRFGTIIGRLLAKRYSFIFFESFQTLPLHPEVRQKSFVVPHPVSRSESPLMQLKGKYIFAPSGSSDSVFMENFATAFDSYSDGTIKLVYKSKFPRQGKSSVAKSYFESIEYEQLMGSAAAILIPFPERKWLRISNVVNESISHLCRIITFPNEYTSAMALQYPNLFLILDRESPVELQIQRVSNWLELSANFEEDARRFLDEHSIEIAADVLAHVKCVENAFWEK